MLLPTLIVIIIVLTIYLAKVLSKTLNYWKERGVKYVQPIPFFGNMLPTITQSKSMAELISYFYNTFPNERFIGIYQFTTPILLLRDPELIKNITRKNFDNFVDHQGFMPVEADPLWGKNLFASRGERWRDLRQTLSPVFTSSKMRSMFILMDDCAKGFVDYFKNNNSHIIEVELKDLFARYTTDVIATTAFGIKCDSLKHKDNEFLVAGRNLINFTGLNKFKFLLYGNYPALAKFLGLKIIGDKVGNFFTSIINETIKLRESNNTVRPDLIHLLMLARNGKLKYEDQMNLPEAGFAAVKETQHKTNGVDFLTNEDITAQAVNFFFGGFDTSSTMMSFLGHELTVNPHIQKKLREEITNTSRLCNGKITYELLLNMKYLDMVICETLRKWPQGLWLDRICTKSFEIAPEKGNPGLKISAGDLCWIPVFGIHRDPKYYPKPKDFNPERFSDENKDRIQSSTYLPFGDGPRNCIGSRFALLETKILLYYLLLDYEFVPTAKTQNPLKICPSNVLLAPVGGFHVGLKLVPKTTIACT